MSGRWIRRGGNLLCAGLAEGAVVSAPGSAVAVCVSSEGDAGDYVAGALFESDVAREVCGDGCGGRGGGFDGDGSGVSEAGCGAGFGGAECLGFCCGCGGILFCVGVKMLRLFTLWITRRRFGAGVMRRRLRFLGGLRREGFRLGFGGCRWRWRRITRVAGLFGLGIRFCGRRGIR